MKKIYFVRHGESEGNAGPVRQTKLSPLTKKGKQQANSVAKRCAEFPIETIICSTMTRAKETAEIILKNISKPIEYSDLFIERRRPKEVYGKPKDDPIGIEVEKSIENNFHLPGFRFSNEENFEDLKKRAREALQYLANRKEENILVVTHGLFMRILVAYVLFGEKLTGEECSNFMKGLYMENTGISAFEYGEIEKIPHWWLWMWNDHSHLD